MDICLDCVHCGQRIKGQRKGAKYCSRQCVGLAQADATRERWAKHRAQQSPECIETGCTNPRRRRGGDKPGLRTRCGPCERKQYPDDPIKRRASWRAKNHRRRSRCRAAFDEVTPERERELRAKAKRCPLCKVRLTDVPYLPASKELDHIIPKGPEAGGTHTNGNVRIICRACNVRRPKDGSDYAGPVTLWAQLPGYAPTPRACVPKPARPPWVPPRQAAGVRAAELRAQGWKWTDIARTLGFTSGSGAQAAATAHGLPEVKAAWPGRYVHGGQRRTHAVPIPKDPWIRCVDCNDPVVPNTERCAECWVEIQGDITDSYLKSDVELVTMSV